MTLLEISEAETVVQFTENLAELYYAPETAGLTSGGGVVEKY